MKRMKFLFAALALVLAGVWASPAKAQVHTYISEDFSDTLKAPNWNLAACTKISQKTGILYYVYTSETDKWGGWIYDPNKEILTNGATDILRGTYQIVSNPVQLKGDDTLNTVLVTFMYAAYENTGRKFGVHVREKDGTTWEKLSEITDANMEDGFVMATLPAKWSGKTVELALMFTTTYKTGEQAYYFFMGNVTFAAYKNVPEVELENHLSVPVVHGGDKATMNLYIYNTGAVKVNNIELTYTIDQSAPVSTSKQFTPNPLEILLGIADAPIELENSDKLTPGRHKAKIWASKLNGAANEKKDTVEWEFYVTDESKLSQAYVPLFESFTSATCGPCATANKTLNPVQEELHQAGALNVVKYQMNFPGNGDKYYIAGNKTRMTYYDGIFGWGGSWGVPTPIYNGMTNISDWYSGGWTAAANKLKAEVNAEHQKKAVMEIKIKQADVPAGSTNRLNLEFEVTPSFDVDGKVFAVLVEKTTTKNRGSNGETKFHYVTLDFPLSANGSAKSFKAGQTETFKVEGRSLGSTKMEEVTDLEVVCFVQHESGYIFQSASTIVTTPASNQNNAALAPVRMYPNPATDEVTLQGLTKADISLIDLTGRVVYQTKGVDGDLDINLKSLNSGTYMVRISQNGNTGFKKLIVK